MFKSLKNVTFISLLKDNEDDSSLLVNYLKKKKLNFNHIISDGSERSQKKIFKDLKNPFLKYYYFGYDHSYLDLYKKIKKSLNKVNTKYVYFLDQGDYLNFEVLNKSIKLLEKNKNYSCCIGRVFNFKIVKNQIVLISELYKEKINNHKEYFQRIINNFHMRSYHALHKTKILKKSISIITNLKVEEPRTAEFIIDTNNLINGNMCVLKNTILLHNASKAIKGKSSLNKKHDNRKIWYDTYLQKNFKKIFQRLFASNSLEIKIDKIKKFDIFFKKNDILVHTNKKNSLINRFHNRIRLISIKKQNNVKHFLKSINDIRNK